MTNQEFRCWMSGYLMLSDETIIDKRQLQIIINHTQLAKAVSNGLEPDLEMFLSKVLENSHQEMSREQLDSIYTQTINFNC